MTLTITYFPHGTTIDNENHISSGRNDAPLSALGIKQSQNLTQLIADKSFDAVFCSDMSRSIDSARLTFGDTLPIVIDPRLRECNYGTYNGQSSDIVEPLQEQNITTRFPDGESYDDVKVRIEEFITSIKPAYNGKHIAIVAHKAPQIILDMIANHKTWEQGFADDRRKTKSRQPGREYILH
ncbi:histidine phosphatase family protein [Patescibacteria group bacterium]|nr:histidine phosphatase family protein [Patescibacteria group bacterium]